MEPVKNLYRLNRMFELTDINKKVKNNLTAGNKVINKMKVFVENNCRACENVLRIVDEMYDRGLLKKLIIINREDEPEECLKYNVLVYPAVFIDDELIFYGEFIIDDALKYAKNVFEVKNAHQDYQGKNFFKKNLTHN